MRTGDGDGLLHESSGEVVHSALVGIGGARQGARGGRRLVRSKGKVRGWKSSFGWKGARGGGEKRGRYGEGVGRTYALA